jgi:hypothetical protein
LLFLLLLGFDFSFALPHESRQAGQANPEGAAHMDVRRFRRRRMRLPEIPVPFADPAALSPGATLGRLSFGYFSLPFKEK